jgi:hypothetical protein
MDSIVEPNENAPQAPPEVEPTQAAPAPEEAPAVKLPLVLLKMPAMQALMAGAPPAVSGNIKDFSKRGEAKEFVTHKDALAKSGFGFYKSLSGDVGVIFNMLHLHPQDLIAADKAGQLKTIAPDFDVVDHSVSKSGHTNPVFHAQGVPNAPAGPKAIQPPQFATGGALPPQEAPAQSQLPASAQRKALQARLMNIAPGAPTSGPAPGQGRLLNSILKPVV